MKPHEETWRQSEAYPRDVFGRDGGDVLFEGVEDVDAEARARLAAQAPAMARLLLSRVENTDSGRDDVDWYCFACGHGGRHQDDCELITVLRAAGVLE